MSLDLLRELDAESRHADHMAEMAGYWMRRAQNAEALVMLAVHAAGGEIRIKHGALAEAPSLTLIKEECPEDFCFRLRVKAKQNA